ncbi:hypothetical protein GGS20DRAFT_175461 [Poronia punctata]|nr:hypothetical protein GGS20DRAFT_175461 [Poronia punctata]
MSLGISSEPCNTELTAAPAPDAPYTRLHITPFDPSLENVVLPASVLPHARNISFHVIQTFPDKPFGFVDLPVMDADRLKKKLNGAVLKGKKMRIETARPQSTPEPMPLADTISLDTKREKKRTKKREREPGVIEGVRLDGRKVKRGWTTTEQEMIEEKRKMSKREKREEKPKDAKKDKDKKAEKKTRVKSKYTDETECLFKTRLPSVDSPKEAEASDSTHNKKRKRKSDRSVVVHEFEKTVKYPTFLKSALNAETLETTAFEDGVGWVDSAGTVVEPIKSKRRPEGIPGPRPSQPETAVEQLAPVMHMEEDDETSSSGSSSSSSSGEEEEEEEELDHKSRSSDQLSDVSPTKNMQNTAPVPHEDAEPISGGLSASKLELTRPNPIASGANLSIIIPPATPPTKDVHPLEALYKRPQGGDGVATVDTENQPFSFFGNGDDIDGLDLSAPASQIPMTPFTEREFEFRNVRSAAPTPDTAHPSRSFNFWAVQGSVADATKEDEAAGDLYGADEDYGVVDSAVGAPEETSQAPLSDFQQQFWESRGDLNRAWRKRRKSAAKDKRYRENKARAERAI